MIYLNTILVIICVYWLFKMMIDLANNDFPELMMKCFFIMCVLGWVYFQTL